MAIDTTLGTLYWYYEPYSAVAGICSITTDLYGNPLVWFADTNDGNYAIGDCGGLGQQGCQ